jgi:flagellar motor protein MotB
MNTGARFRLVAVVLAVTGLPACVSITEYRKLEFRAGADRARSVAFRERIAEVARENVLLKQDLDRKVSDYQRAQVDLADAAGRMSRVSVLRGERDALVDNLEAMRREEERRAVEVAFGELDDGQGVRFDPGSGRLTLMSKVLFRPGRALIRVEGQKALRKVAEALHKSDGPVRIEGHTDSDPVRNSKKSWKGGNWELSGARAMHVLHFLVNEGGIEESRVAYVGYGSQRPITDNQTAEKKARNRRVEIYVERVQGEGQE